ncbi:ATP-grasp domain-containing protein [Micromonospora sp. WMMD882]|uniref:ATP-grasp domain-containing protein n=1 Tax=Micromonospora sp. WMMD882 TaxID=3015151 RepID=UPI00248BB6F3|nr:ATP-grasp domain-containing protein [Micromonospora sp. WMMD882]WBB78438.1 ATP-grasp domain-containing protein [Micromonospora sp. WMMD882]
MPGTEHVLIVGGGREIPQLLRRHRAGSRTSVLCQLSLLPKLRDIDEHERVVGLRADASDEEWIAAARQVHRADPVTRIASFGERDQRRLAVVGSALGLSTHSVRTVAAVHDKHLMRQLLADAGVEKVAAVRLDDEAAVTGWVDANPGAWVLKPVDGTASAGVALVRTPGEAAAAYRRCVATEHTGRRHSPEVLLEEYLTGPQVSVESLSEDGEHVVVAVTGKYSDPATFVELGHVVPAVVDDAARAGLVAHTGAVLDALGVRDGTCHTEFVLTPDGPRTIETHLRVAGDEIPYLVRDATGVDLVGCVVRQTFGERVLPEVRRTLAATPARPQAIWFGVAPCAGEVDRWEGLDEARAADPSVTLTLEAGPGDRVAPLGDSHSRVVWARAEGGTADEALRRAYAAVAACRLVVTVPTVAGGGVRGAL